MTESEELKFIKRWLAAMDNYSVDYRAKMNSISIRLTGKYVGIEAVRHLEAIDEASHEIIEQALSQAESILRGDV